MAPLLTDSTSLEEIEHFPTKRIDRPFSSPDAIAKSQSAVNDDSDRIPTTLLSLLQRAAERWPNHGIDFKIKGWDQTTPFLTYSDLLHEAKTNAAALRSLGIVTPSKVTVLYFDNHRDNTVWYWSTMAAGGVPALLSPLSSNKDTREMELKNLVNLFRAPSIITANHLAGLFEEMPSTTVTSTTNVLAKSASLPARIPVIDDAVGHEDELATVLFTSGSTGPAKGVEYTHTQLVTSSRLKSEFHQMDANKTFMSWVGFDHSAALCENHLHAIYAGANQVMIPAIDLIQKPMRFWKVLSDHRVAYTFAPNFFIAAAIKGLNEMSEVARRELNLDFQHLRVIMCGGEANKTATLEAAERVLTHYNAPKCSIKASYGLSETCSALFYNVESPGYDVEREYLFASAGKHLPQHELRIVDEDGRHVQQGEPGAIQVRGVLVFQRYFNNETATRSCKTEDGWFDTGDQGKLDEQGNLRIIGRSKEILIINGQNYSSFELEHAIESTNIAGLNKSYTASFSVWIDGAESEDIVILFNPSNNDARDSHEVRRIVAQMNEASIRFCRKKPYTVIPLPREKLPKSSIGKLSRAKLKKSYQAGDFDEFLLPTDLGLSEGPRGAELTSPLQQIIGNVLSEEAKTDSTQIHMNSQVSDFGLDSLGYLRVKRALETALDIEEPLSMPSLLACRTIADMDQMLLSIGTTTSEYDPIVPLVTSGSKPPLILGHPGGGEFLGWMGLLKYIPDRPVLALRVRGFHKDELPFESLEEMLDVYVAGIRRYYPHGPYAMLGLCFGGMLAFELGKRFEAAGEEVVFCGGIDNPPEVGRMVQTQGKLNDRQFVLQLLYFYGVITHEQIKPIMEELRDVPDEEFLRALHARFTPGRLEKVGLTFPRIQSWQRINLNMQQIGADYVPHGRVSKYDLFWVPPRADLIDCTVDEWMDNWLVKWKDHVSTGHEGAGKEHGVRYHRVTGDHFTVLSPENIGRFQEALTQALEARRA